MPGSKLILSESCSQARRCCRRCRRSHHWCCHRDCRWLKTNLPYNISITIEKLHSIADARHHTVTATRCSPFQRLIHVCTAKMCHPCFPIYLLHNNVLEWINFDFWYEYHFDFIPKVIENRCVAQRKRNTKKFFSRDSRNHMRLIRSENEWDPWYRLNRSSSSGIVVSFGVVVQQSNHHSTINLSIQAVIAPHSQTHI